MRIDVFPHVLHKARKNGRFTYEPSVLYCTLAKAAEAAKESCSAIDFLLHGRLARESWRAGAADTGRDKAEEGGMPAVVFRPTTTQDVPASVRLRGCASRASRPVFLLKRKEDGSHTNRPFCVARWRKRQKRRRKTFPHSTFFCVVGLHGKAGAQARRTRAETRRRREAYPLWYSDRRQRRMCLRPSV